MLEMTPIMSNLTVTQEDLVRYMAHRGKKVDKLEEITRAYTTYGNLTGIGNVMPFAQAIHETGWFTSRRWIQNYNPAGIGATNDGAEGHVWTNPEQGIIAQYAHLMAYALPRYTMTYQQKALAQVSPRYGILEAKGLLGSSPNWVDLNGKWAFPGTTYAQRIASIAEHIIAFTESN